MLAKQNLKMKNVWSGQVSDAYLVYNLTVEVIFEDYFTKFSFLSQGKIKENIYDLDPKKYFNPLTFKIVSGTRNVLVLGWCMVFCFFDDHLPFTYTILNRKIAQLN